MPSKLKSQIANMARQRLIPAVVLDVLGPLCDVRLSTRGKTLHGLKFSGGTPTVGMSVYVDYRGGTPTVLVGTDMTNIDDEEVESTPPPVELPSDVVPKLEAPPVKEHNMMPGLQGGQAMTHAVGSEYYHLTSSERTTALRGGHVIKNPAGSSMTQRTNLKFSGNVTVNDSNLSNWTEVIVGSATSLEDLDDVDVGESKTTPVDADSFLLRDSEDSDIWKLISYLNLKTAIAGSVGEHDHSDASSGGTELQVDKDLFRFGFIMSYDGTQETTISFDGTNTFTLAPTGTSWSYYRLGVKYTITGSKTCTLSGSPPATKGLYYIYIDATNGTLSCDTGGWTLMDTKVPVATIAWDNSLTPKYWMSDERHTCAIDRRFHFEHHWTDGTEITTAPVLSGYTVAPVSPSDTHNTFAISESKILDEDLYHVIAQVADPGGSSDAYYVLYRTGSSTWSWKYSPVPFDYKSSAPAGYIYYNNGTSVTEGQNNKYYNVWMILTNVSGLLGFAFIMGQAEYSTLTQAQAARFDSLTKTGIPIAEFVAVYQLTFFTNSSYTTKGKVRLAAEPVRISVSVTGSTTDIGTKVTSVSKDGEAKITGDVTFTEGTNITITQDGNNLEIASSGGTGGHVIQWEGVDQTERAKLNFEGGITITDDAINDATVVNVSSTNMHIDQAGGTDDTYGVLAGTRDGENTEFTVSEEVYITGTLKVYLNGQLLTQGDSEDWWELVPGDGTFEFAVAPEADDQITVYYGTPISGIVDASKLSSNIEIGFDGSGQAPTTGVLLDWVIPFTLTLTGWKLYSTLGGSGSIVFDLWVDTDANFPPTVADSICGGSKPTLSGASKASGSVASWDTVLATGDILRVNIDSASTLTRGLLVLSYTRN